MYCDYLYSSVNRDNIMMFILIFTVNILLFLTYSLSLLMFVFSLWCEIMEEDEVEKKSMECRAEIFSQYLLMLIRFDYMDRLRR